jgi:arylformamidase
MKLGGMAQRRKWVMDRITDPSHDPAAPFPPLFLIAPDMKRFLFFSLLAGMIGWALSLPLSADEKAKADAVATAPRVPPTHADVAYGPHERNRLDCWLAKGDGPRPLLVYIHGGGWTGSDKVVPPDELAHWLAKGVSVAAVTYRFTPGDPLPAPVHDAARAVQFLRSKAADWNLDKTRVCLTGTSAGACTSMWLLCHDDLADPKSPDPVLRESTRVSGAAVARGQSSIDPKQIEPWLGPEVLKHRMIPMAVGELTIDDALKNYERHRATYIEFSPYNHVSAGDPPLFLKADADLTVPAKNSSHGIHHPVFCTKMKEKADSVGMECHIQIGKAVPVPDKYPGPTEFLEARLLGKDL